MKKFPADYSGFRLQYLDQPRFRHLKLLFGWICYLTFFFLTERVIPPERTYLVQIPLDSRIPLVEGFVLPYISWYFLIAGTVFYFLLYNIDGFRKLQWHFILVQSVAIVMFVLFPTRQELRPAVLPGQGLWAKILSWLYRVDTNTGVFPSMHTAFSLVVFAAWRREPIRPVYQYGLFIWTVLICLSVVFIRQHSVLDALAGIALSLAAEFLVYKSSRQD